MATTRGDVDIVLKVYLHCEECIKPIVKCLQDFPGVEEVKTDLKDHKVTLKASKDVDPTKVVERVVKKCNKQVELVSPKPKDKPAAQQQRNEPNIIQVILSIYIHCENCGKKIRENIKKMKGVQNVEMDAENSKATVKGEIEPQNLLNYVNSKLGKQATVVKVINQARSNNNNNNETQQKQQQQKQQQPQQQQQQQGSQNENNTVNRRLGEVNSLDRPSPEQFELLYQFESLSDENTQACTIM